MKVNINREIKEILSIGKRTSVNLGGYMVIIFKGNGVGRNIWT